MRKCRWWNYAGPRTHTTTFQVNVHPNGDTDSSLSHTVEASGVIHNTFKWITDRVISCYLLALCWHSVLMTYIYIYDLNNNDNNCYCDKVVSQWRDVLQVSSQIWRLPSYRKPNRAVRTWQTVACVVAVSQREKTCWSFLQAHKW